MDSEGIAKNSKLWIIEGIVKNSKLWISEWITTNFKLWISDWITRNSSYRLVKNYQELQLLRISEGIKNF